MELSIKEQKQLKKRDYMLNGNLWRVIISISLPMILYNLCNYFYGIYDMMIAQATNIGEAADIVVLDQIKNMISTIGGALAAGGGILVAKRYGEKKNSEAKKAANTLFTLALVIALLTLIFIPIGEPFLKLFKTDQSTIDNAIGYYNVQIITLVVTTMNSTMISLEKAKGNTFKLLCLNIIVIILKISFTTLFAFGPFENVTSTWLAISTLIAQLFMFFAGLILCFNKNNILGISLKELNFNKEIVSIIIKLSIPVFLGNFLFSFGKVYINSIATETYGKMCVGALGISNTMAGLIVSISNSISDSSSVIVSQNFGAKKGKRIQKIFKIIFAYITSIALLGTTVLFLLKKQIASFYAPNDLIYQEMIINIFAWECFDITFLGFSSVASALFNGLGKTKITMTFSMLRLFAFRIPILLILINLFQMNYISCGVTMFASNFISGVIEIILIIVFIKKLPNKQPQLFEKLDQ